MNHCWQKGCETALFIHICVQIVTNELKKKQKQGWLQENLSFTVQKRMKMIGNMNNTIPNGEVKGDELKSIRGSCSLLNMDPLFTENSLTI
jgi:predicted metal-dependent hydrolase